MGAQCLLFEFETAAALTPESLVTPCGLGDGKPLGNRPNDSHKPYRAIKAQTLLNAFDLRAKPKPRRAKLNSAPSLMPDISIRDWDELLSAVKARLKLTVGEHLAATPRVRAHDTSGEVLGSVLECVTALDQLHSTLKHEHGRRRQLELEVVTMQSALAQARAELVGTQAGERHARHLALHDGLTSLPNRSYFLERLNQALDQGDTAYPMLTVLYLDLDGFKPINDAYGHAAGDELLKIVAARLTRVVRAEDMMSRLGGDEFACLLADLPDREQLSHLACKLFDAVSAPLQIGQLSLTVRPSIGIAVCPTDGTTAEALLKNADTAMYRAKRQQTGYAFFNGDCLTGGC